MNRKITLPALLSMVLIIAMTVLACRPETTPGPSPTPGQPTTMPPTTPTPEDFHLTGIIESIEGNTWKIGGQTFKTDQNTVLDSGLAVGVEARVEYQILTDGTKLAMEIETDKNAPTTVPDSVKLKLVAEGFTSPVGLISPPDNSRRLFAVDQIGIIWVLTPDGNRQSEPFLDLRSKMVKLDEGFDERGLLGLAFHPSFKDNSRFFVYYSAPLRNGGPQGWDHTSHISEFKIMASNPDKADPASERIILQVDEPQANHNAGGITFGPDNFLYIPLGDGGGANDVGLGHPSIGNGQDITTPLGSILRIDVDGGNPYGIPPDNPFVGKDGQDEIFAFGFRNPFRISFDTGGQHELFVGDVGQRLREEVDIVTIGGNYGWNIKEGTIWFDPQNPGSSSQTGPTVDARGQPLIDPIIDYVNTAGGGEGSAVIGGFIYRGSALPSLNGTYIFGDYTASRDKADGRLFIARRSTETGKWTMKELKIASSASGRLDSNLRSFGQDASGELYVLVADPRGPQGATGKIFKIVP